MDTSKEYIKMSDCEEIQGRWVHSSGDWFYAKDDLGDGNDKDFIAKGEIVCSGDIVDFSWESSCDFGGGIENFNKAVWLPTQSQLQGMVGGEASGLIEGLYRFITDTGWDDWEAWFKYVNRFTSMEQLWLAFVMKEKYNKKWNGSDWIKDK